MSYLAFDLDALNVARDVGDAAGIPEERVTHGLLRMWAWCFRQKTDLVEPVQIRGFFGTSDAASSLRAFGFLEDAEEKGWRVKGASRYLRVSSNRSKGGKAASANLKQHRLDTGSTPAAAGSQPVSDTGSTPALTPSTEHRTPSTNKEEETSTVTSEAVEPPQIANPDSPALRFFCWAQDTRTETGLPREKPPRRIEKLSAWYSEAMSELNGDEERLREAWFRYGDDKFWEQRAFPFAGFMSQWGKHVTQSVLQAAAES